MSSLDFEPVPHVDEDDDDDDGEGVPFWYWAECQRRALAERRARTLADVELAYQREAARLEGLIGQVEKDLAGDRLMVQ